MWISDLRRFTVYPQSSLTITKTQAVALDALKFSIHFKILSAARVVLEVNLSGSIRLNNCMSAM